ncbi:hypothetical protein ADM98_09185 [Exiguobacterium sp. BMC-KP]|uniref:hypothetical protein n=1 Tax=Exiguobacterium sp. BMC-KP TaxID=1684312 RepID=UPI0006AA1D1F|nr:hypothetical protein [Exiguobacterium sp. BMC-KP]KOP29076.1 hypothetical protein ADM98_09185 [Exiguobacterium sp. BMC-KP]
MTHRDVLLERLDAIGQTIAQTDDALVLLGLGSVGQELERLDDYSDLDFFVIAKPGKKVRFIEQLDWLENAHPLQFQFQNTQDGHKIMFDDGIYAEFAIFELDELSEIAFSAGRIVWCDSSFDAFERLVPQPHNSSSEHPSIDYAIHEALTNLYVGLCREARGETLSAFRLIQQFAVGQLIYVLSSFEKEEATYVDPFAPERRIEQRFPEMVNRFSEMMPGYLQNKTAALAILDYIEQIHPVSPAMSTTIRSLARTDTT